MRWNPETIADIGKGGEDLESQTKEQRTSYKLTADFNCVRMQRVHIFSQYCRPPTVIVRFCTFALNSRFVRGAFRSQRPECLCLMLRP